jgi:response regulator RpfG family c-di-GMP phosphodiesterase
MTRGDFTGDDMAEQQKIVIIDDDKFMLTILDQLVSTQTDKDRFIFESPVAALDWCKHNEPDLILVDYMMPNMNGLQFITAFRKLKGKDIPVIMITALNDRHVRFEALDKGANEFLEKPIDETEFQVRIRNLLSLRHSQKLLADRALHLADEVEKSTLQLQHREDEIIFRLAKAAEYRHNETGSHLVRIMLYADHIGKSLGFSNQDRLLFKKAAIMHDIGKVGIPDDILLKPGRLTEREFDSIKEHPLIGYNILKDSSSLVLQAGATVALTHHERFDGKGYPHGLSGNDIPLFGRLISVVDMFDALVSRRTYKEPWPISHVVDEIKSLAGANFDPDCVNAFFKDWSSIERIMKIDETLALDNLWN